MLVSKNTVNWQESGARSPGSQNKTGRRLIKIEEDALRKMNRSSFEERLAIRGVPVGEYEKQGASWRISVW
jgi:hypothetical protein